MGYVLTKKKCVFIRKLYATGDYTYKQLAERHGVSINSIYLAVTKYSDPRYKRASERSMKRKVKRNT